MQPWLLGIRIGAAEIDHHGVSVAGCCRSLGYRFRQGLDHQIDQQAQRREVPLNGERFDRADNRPLSNSHLQRLERTAVGRPVGINKQLVGNAGGGNGLRRTAIDRTGAGVIALAQVDDHVLAGHDHLDPHGHLVKAHPIAVNGPFGPIRTIGNGRDELALESLRLGEDLISGPHHGLGAESPEDLRQTLGPGVAAGDLGPQVADCSVVEPAVLADRLGQRQDLHTVFNDLDRGEPKTFLEHISRIDRAPGILRSDIQPMRPRRRESEQFGAVKDRLHHRHVMQMGSGYVWVVHDPHISRGPYLPAIPLFDGDGAGFQVPQEDREAR